MQWTVINESSSSDQLPFNDLLAESRETVPHSLKGQTAVLSQLCNFFSPAGDKLVKTQGTLTSTLSNDNKTSFIFQNRRRMTG